MPARFRLSRWLWASLKILFVCARNRLRSPTAEAIFSGIDGVAVASAGTAPDAACPISADLIEWADGLYVMEARQKVIVRRRFAKVLEDRPVVCLGIPDRYASMQPELIAILKNRMSRYLPGIL